MAKKETKVEKVEKEYIIPLRWKVEKTVRYKRANKAIRTIKEFLVRHMKIRDRDLNKIKIDQALNEEVWFRGIKKPPAKIKVNVVKEGEIVRVYLAEVPEAIKFRKQKLEKREKVAEVNKKKKVEKKEEENSTSPEAKVETAEQKEEEKEKKTAVVEEGQKLEKAAAKQIKHETKVPKEKSKPMKNVGAKGR